MEGLGRLGRVIWAGSPPADAAQPGLEIYLDYGREHVSVPRLRLGGHLLLVPIGGSYVMPSALSNLKNGYTGVFALDCVMRRSKETPASGTI